MEQSKVPRELIKTIEESNRWLSTNEISKRVAVPDVTALHVNDAVDVIYKVNLDVDTENRVCCMESGYVLTQMPRAGTLVEQDSCITLVVSQQEGSPFVSQNQNAIVTLHDGITNWQKDIGVGDVVPRRPNVRDDIKPSESLVFFSWYVPVGFRGTLLMLPWHSIAHRHGQVPDEHADDTIILGSKRDDEDGSHFLYEPTTFMELPDTRRWNAQVLMEEKAGLELELEELLRETLSQNHTDVFAGYYTRENEIVFVPEVDSDAVSDNQ